MSQSKINTPHGDKLRESMDIKEKPNSTYLQETKPIERTPFDMCSIQKEDETYEHFAALGRYAITPKMRDQESVIKYLNDEHWHVTLAIIVAWGLGEKMVQKVAENKKGL